ncbi:unnamed protein product, partial [Mesorhabditis belari]|uniref:Vitellogenin n=1 Tax=Mesorhabditis belari TaxID=2138241 RepID=A0AAF3E8R5_9BILA
MKLLAAFGLLAIALAASSRQWEERSFNKGNTYEFEWKGQIVSGVPVKGSSSHSLQQIHSKVLITVNEKHSILRLDNVKLTNGHKQLTEPRIISEVSLEESQLTSEQREQIKLPIRFRYHQGIISEIVFSEEESAWSENIKRSILNMLQVQMSPRKTQEEYNTKTVSNNKFFTVTERTLEGECEVAYTIVESEKNREEKEITKSLNFEKCPKRIDIRYGPRYSAECSMCEATDARPESQTVINYKVRGEDEERFLITEVELKSEYVFTPLLEGSRDARHLRPPKDAPCQHQKVIYDRRQPLVVRQSAVDALRMLRDQMPRKEELMEKIVRSDSSISSSEMIRKIAKGFRFEGVLSGYVYEHVRIVPTTLGLPLQVTSKLPTEKTIRIPSFEKTSVHYEQSYGEEHFGLRTEVIGSVHRHVFDKKSPESILFGENHVQVVLVPTAESVKEIVLEVDGRRVEDEEALYDMGIKLIGESSCEITIPKMTIRFDGYKVEIKADKRTENTQCGLCGHFDGRRDNEFRRADNEETEDIEEFHRSWLRRDNECEVEESKLKEKKNYGVESDEEERYDSEESFWNPREDFEEENMGEKRSRKMLKKNLKKHISRKNIRDEEENTYEPENEIVMVEREGKTCFSMEEQPKCQPGDELIETENRKVKLACLPRSDRSTRRIVNGLKRGEESIMEEIRSLSMSLTERIELPKLCRVY